MKKTISRVGAKLILLLIVAMSGVFALLGYLNIRLHRQQLEAATLASAERVSDVIERSTSFYMLHNDREGLYRIIRTLADEPGMERIRVFNREGRISFSTEPSEVDHYVDKRTEACFVCHASAQPLTHLDRPDRFRIFRVNGNRVLGVINPIENRPDCSNAACHAHPDDQKILGVFDTHLSLAAADAGLAQSSRQMLLYTIVMVAAISLLTGAFVMRVVQRPLARLRDATVRLARGELGYQIPPGSADEIGELASSFNGMSRQLAETRGEITAWTHTLEARVEQKAAELRRAHDHMLQVEKMASVGKLAAVVAHEINNPLAGILTYAKLLRKWLGNPAAAAARGDEIRNSLELIESESRRCGDIVKNLLMFSRTAPMNVQPVDLNAVVDRSLRLVQHQLELSNIQLARELQADLPAVECDAAQIEQVVLALTMNAIEAMPRGGRLRLATRHVPDSGEAQIQVQDDGAGISPEVLAHLFEPFFTTKEAGRGVGLGLAVSHGIAERHRGKITVASEVGRGTTFTLTLPAGPPAGAPGEGDAAHMTAAK